MSRKENKYKTKLFAFFVYHITEPKFINCNDNDYETMRRYSISVANSLPSQIAEKVQTEIGGWMDGWIYYRVLVFPPL